MTVTSFVAGTAPSRVAPAGTRGASAAMRTPGAGANVGAAVVAGSAAFAGAGTPTMHATTANAIVCASRCASSGQANSVRQ